MPKSSLTSVFRITRVDGTDRQTLAAFIMHGAKLTQEEYNPIKQGFLDCIGKEGCYTVSPH
jgi:hypothetical protein